METLVLNGKTYVKASKAAKSLGYTSDYVGQLCRSKQVDAHLVGRSWYVDQKQLGEHRVEKKRMSRVKAREQAHKSIEEHRKLRIQETKNTHKNISISYENDDNELIPDVRKLHIDATPTEHHAEQSSRTKDDKIPYSIENKGEKIVMSGKIKIRDASEDAIDEDTVMLTSHIERHRRTSNAPTRLRAIEEIAHTETEETPVTIKETPEIKQKPKSFVERLVNFKVQTEDKNLEDGEPVNFAPKEAVIMRTQKRTSFWISGLLSLVLLLISIGSLAIESVWEYTIDPRIQTIELDTSYRVEFRETYDELIKKLESISD